MHDAGGVGPRQRVGDGDGDAQRLAAFEARGDQRAQRASVDVLHHDEVDAVGGGDVEHDRDVSDG